MNTTSSQFKRGHLREDGKRFWCYEKRSKGPAYELWLDEATYLRFRIKDTYNAAKGRARKQGVPFSLTKDDIALLFPKDGLCPILGVQMAHGPMDERDTSPSLDRIEPKKGYTKDNCIIISYRANRIKNDSTIEELEMILNYYKTLRDYGQESA